MMGKDVIRKQDCSCLKSLVVLFGEMPVMFESQDENVIQIVEIVTLVHSTKTKMLSPLFSKSLDIKCLLFAET